MPLPTGTATAPEVNFVGLENFRTIFASGSSQNYLHFIRNTVIFTVATIVLKTVIALGLAVLLTWGIKRLAYFHRVVMYLPAVLPMLVVALVFKSILNPATGLLNESLRSVGLGFLAQKWLVDVHWALPSVIGVDTWRGVGYIMVILIAGLQAIPREYYEAACHRRRQRLGVVLAHHDSAADARADGDDGAQPALRAQGLRHRLCAHQRRARPCHRYGLHGDFRGVLQGPLRRSHHALDHLCSLS